MHPVPDVVMRHYETVLKMHEIPLNLYANYRKWLRYFLDFRFKYLNSCEGSEQVRLFLGKLRGKKQSEAQCQQAAHAVSLYFEIIGLGTSTDNPVGLPDRRNCDNPISTDTPMPIVTERISQYCVAGYPEKSDSREWDAVLEAMAAEIKAGIIPARH